MKMCSLGKPITSAWMRIKFSIHHQIDNCFVVKYTVKKDSC